MSGKFMKTRRWRLQSGEVKVYAYHSPRYSALARCRRYLRKPGAALVPVGHAGRWIAAGDLQFQNKTVRRLIQLGYAAVDEHGAVRRVVR